MGNYDFGSLGYVVEEYFLEGVATSYKPRDARAEPDGEAGFKTRVVVARPADNAAASGTVAVEWLNVSGGLDAAPGWYMAHRHLVRSGAAWVGVSAQSVGIEGGGFLITGEGVRRSNPERYGGLHHPGDAWSFDIFAQAGDAARRGDVLGGLEPTCLLAMGSSQSAMFLVSFVNLIDRLTPVYDAFLVHGRGAQGTPLEGTFTPRPRGEDGGIIFERPTQGDPINEPRVPVLTVQSETDVVDLYGFGGRSPDGDLTRTWEIAGAAHFDAYGLIAAAEDDGDLSPEELARLAAPTDEPLGLPAEELVNSSLAIHYVLHAAHRQLERWVRDGHPAPQAPLLATTGEGEALELERDELGNALGGIRTPWVDAPTAQLTGIGGKGGDFTFLFGVTRPFDSTTLDRLYPAGLDDYLEAFTASLESSQSAGFILADDAPEILALARAMWLQRD